MYDFAILGIPITLLVLERIKSPLAPLQPLALGILWILPLMCLIIFLLVNVQLCPFALLAYLIALAIQPSRQSKEHVQN